MVLLIRFLGIVLLIFSFLNCNAVEKERTELVVDKPEIRNKIQTNDELQRLVLESLTIGELKGEAFVINTAKEKTIIEKITKLIKNGAKVNENHVLSLLSRDGSGENQVTSKNILKLLLDNYSGKKNEILNQSLLLSILNTNSEIVSFLISQGAKPTSEEITEVIRNTAPDYYPSYETLKLLVEKLHFDLYKNCNVTLSWWLIQEHQFFGNSISKEALNEEVKKRKSDFFLICNTIQDDGSFFDSELFPTNQSAFDLAEKSKDAALKKWAASFQKN